MVSAIERCPLFLSAIKSFFYETLTMISSVLRKSVRYREVSAIKHVRYREVPLYQASIGTDKLFPETTGFEMNVDENIMVV